MPGLESRIDELYQGPLNAFVASRTALAKTLKGTDAQRVKALAKPTLVPWAVNQVYWHARGLYDGLIQSGENLRAAQVAALEGRRADVRGATRAHREAVAKAIARAMEVAAAADAHPSADEVGRTFEALSLARNRPGHPGRLTSALAPAGFEALGGVALKAPVPPPPPPQSPQVAPPVSKPRLVQRDTPAARAAQKARDQELAAALRQKTAAVKKAQAAVDRARAAETTARERWEEAKQSLNHAERTLTTLRGKEQLD